MDAGMQVNIFSFSHLKNTFRQLSLFSVLLFAVFSLSNCTLHPSSKGVSSYGGETRDNRPGVWITNHPKVRHFRDYYLRTRTVEDGLQRGRRYLGMITREFQRRGLPVELAYLPLLESRFINRADSGNAKGMWQFTPQTAKHMGLRVGFMVDERLNWRKATMAAADYLEDLGKKFNYNWTLALAAYNGGPNYVADAMKSQRTWDFWRLSLRKETAEYVPRFIAMLQVAREKYPHLMVAQR